MEQSTLGKERAVNRKTGGDDGGAELDVAPHKPDFKGACHWVLKI